MPFFCKPSLLKRGTDETRECFDLLSFVVAEFIAIKNEMPGWGGDVTKIYLLVARDYFPQKDLCVCTYEYVLVCVGRYAFSTRSQLYNYTRKPTKSETIISQLFNRIFFFTFEPRLHQSKIFFVKYRVHHAYSFFYLTGFLSSNSFENFRNSINIGIPIIYVYGVLAKANYTLYIL